MATCLNLNDPEVQATVLRFGKVATSMILEVYNDKYANRELTLDLSESIYNQMLADKQSYIHPTAAKHLDSVEQIKQELEKTEDFYVGLRGLLDNTNWNLLRDLAKRAEIKGVSIVGAETVFDQLSSETDIKKIAEGILSYFHENAMYLGELSKTLYAYLKDESIPEKERGRTAYFASQLANQIKDNIQGWKQYFPTLLKEGSTNFIKTSFDNIEAVTETINKTNQRFSIPRIAEDLASIIAEQTKELQAENNKKLKELQNEQARLERLQSQGATENRKKIINNLKQAIKELEFRASQYASKENIQRILEDDFANQDHINWLSYWAESAQLSSNILAGSLGNYIWDMQTRADQKSQKFQNKMAKIVERAVQHFRTKNGSYLSSLSDDALFEPYVREVEVVFVNESGQLETRTDLALQSKMDEIGYKNEKVNMEHAIAQKKLRGEDTFEDEEALARFVEANEDRGLTEEYYRIMSSLSPKAKKARKKIIDKMKLLEASDKGDLLNDLVFEQMQDLRFQLERLESFVYPDGTTKKGDDLDIAQDIKKWKEETRAAQLFTYEPEPAKLKEWEAKLKEYQDAITKAESTYQEVSALYEKGEVTAGSLAEAKKSVYTAKRNFDSWAKANVRRTIDPDWYAYRREILDAISEIQVEYQEAFAEENLDLRTASEIWDEIFNVLKGYRDSDGVYVGTDIPLDISNKVKSLQEELKRNMDEYKKAKLVSEEDKLALQDLFSQLNDIQKRQETDYYKAAYENALSQTRAEVVADYMGDNPDLVLKYDAYLKQATVEAQSKNPNLTAIEIGEIAAKNALKALYERESLLNTRTIDREVMAAFKKSAWFKANHIQTEKYDPISRRKLKTFEPLYFWNEVLPWDSTNEVIDETYINRNTPSFRWSSYKVNDQVLDPQTGKPLFVNPDYKYIPGRVQLRPSSQFVNDSYDKLDSTEKEILAELDAMNQETQEDLPSSLRRGLILPSVRKDKFTNLGKSLNPVEQLKLTAADVRDRVLGENEEVEDGLKGEKTSSRVHRRLYLKYSSRMDVDKKSKNVFASLAMFNHEAERFKEALKNSPTLFGLEDVLTSQNVSRDSKSYNTVKMIQDLYEKQLYGITSRDGKIGTTIALLTDPLLNVGRKLSLNYNFPSSIKNFLGNLHNVLIQADEFDLSVSDIFAGMGEGAIHIKDLFLADRDTRVGRESDYVKLLDYFHVFPKQRNEQLRNIVNNPLRETASYSPLSLLRFGRTFFEMEATIGVYEALMKKQIIKNNLGQQKTLKDVYEVVNGEVRIKPEFDETEVKALESYFIKKLHSVTALMQGAYSKIDQSEFRRFALGRLFGYMRTWLAYQTIRRFGGRRISYGGGYEYDGFYRAVIRESANFLKALTLGREGIQAYMLTLDRPTRKALKGALYDTLAIVTLMTIAYALSSLIKNDGDDPDNKFTYFTLYNLAYLIDELETLHPVAGPASIWYGRVSEKNTQVNILQYYFSKNVLLPFRSSYDLLREAQVFATESTYNLFDEYVPRNKEGEIIKRKGIPTNPMLVGHSNIIAQFLKQSKLASSANYLFNPEYQYRTWTHYNPKAFLQSTKEDLEDVRGSVKQLKNSIKALKQEMYETDDPEYQAEIRRLLDERRSDYLWNTKKQLDLMSQQEDDIVQ